CNAASLCSGAISLTSAIDCLTFESMTTGSVSLAPPCTTRWPTAEISDGDPSAALEPRQSPSIIFAVALSEAALCRSSPPFHSSLRSQIGGKGSGKSPVPNSNNAVFWLLDPEFRTRIFIYERLRVSVRLTLCPQR